MEIKYGDEVTGRIELTVHSLPGNEPGTLTLSLESEQLDDDDEPVTVVLANVLTREEAIELMAELAQAVAAMRG
jgi:hypothetical protein